MKRRNFLGSVGAMATLPYARIAGANNRVSVAVIGAGRRGTEVAAAFVANPQADVVAVCDVYDLHAERAQAKLSSAGRRPQMTNAHEDVLARSDVDAVLISTPDHLHVPIACDALAAGKHVYLEKPTVHRWEERDRLQQSARTAGKVLQCGMQQRSGTHYQRAKQEYFDTGKLGRVVQVRCIWSNFPWQQRHIQAQAKPAGLDWDRFLGPAPRIPFDMARYDAWRYYPEYGGGLLADILTHWIDVAQWMLNDTQPRYATALGGIYVENDGRQNLDTVNAIVQYQKWNLSFESSVLPLQCDHPSVYFQGTEASFDLSRDGYTYQPHEGAAVSVKAEGTLEAAHVESFLNAITKDRSVSAPIRAGLEASLPVQMAIRSYWTKRLVGAQELVGTGLAAS